MIKEMLIHFQVRPVHHLEGNIQVMVSSEAEVMGLGDAIGIAQGNTYTALSNRCHCTDGERTDIFRVVDGM